MKIEMRILSMEEVSILQMSELRLQRMKWWKRKKNWRMMVVMIQYALRRLPPHIHYQISLDNTSRQYYIPLPLNRSHLIHHHSRMRIRMRHYRVYSNYFKER